MLSPRRLVRLAHEMAVAGSARVAAMAAIVALSAGSAQAVPIVIDAQDSGWYDDGGDHTATNQNFPVGRSGGKMISSPLSAPAVKRLAALTLLMLGACASPPV